MIEITKYANRRYYAQGRYLTLTQLGEFIDRGDTIRIRPKGKSKDITRLTLLDVLMQRERAREQPRLAEDQLLGLIRSP